MTWADSLQLVERAQAGGYAVGAFNMHSDETSPSIPDSGIAPVRDMRSSRSSAP